MDEELMKSWAINDDPLEQKAVQELQNDLIHISVAYHQDRLRHGHPFGMSNPLKDEQRAKNNPFTLRDSIARDGRLEQKDMVSAVREDGVSPIDYISRGVITSVWDSINHVLQNDTSGIDSRYEDFLSDPDIAAIVEESRNRGRDLWNFKGADTLYTGLSVGVGHVSHFVAMEYALKGHNPHFDAARVANSIAKSDSTMLTCLSMDMLVFGMARNNTQWEKWDDPDSKIGIPYEKLREFLRPNELGCSARGPISDRAHGILQRNAIPTPDRSLTAIKIVTNMIRERAFHDWDELFDSLSEEEIHELIPESDMRFLRR